MRDLPSLTEKWLLENGICHPDGEKTGIIVGLSGGADSVCLLTVLSLLRERCGISLTAVHVHHQIRGAEADRDAAFSEELCRSLGISCQIIARDVPKMAEQKKETLEEAGRNARYDVLEQVRSECGAQWIAVAHHREDVAETVLLNLFRGSGVEGLSGIRPVSGRIIRPLIDCRKEEITSFLTGRGISWMEDSTNASEEGARNQIRNRILPEIKKTWPGVSDSLYRTAKEAALTADFIEEQAEDWLEEKKEESASELVLPIPALNLLSRALKREVLYLAVSKMSGTRKDIAKKHIDEVENLLDAASGRSVDLPHGAAALRNYDDLVLQKKEEKAEIPPDLSGQMQVLPALQAENFPQNDYTKCFAYDKMKKLPIWRFRQPGDVIAVYRDGRGKKLQDFFIDCKVPARLRDSTPVLAIDHQILWVAGIRAGTSYPVTGDTKEVLIVTVPEDIRNNE